jgi:hypothetical protein
MGALTETEIFNCMSENLRTAIDDCDLLATTPLKGPVYNRFRKALKLVEGSCRQASAWRSDTRWLPIGLMMEEAHKRAGEWLRGVKQPNGGRRPIPHGEKHPLFLKLAENLRALLKTVNDLRTKQTSRAGMILPEAGVPIMGGMIRRESGLIIPSRMH